MSKLSARELFAQPSRPSISAKKLFDTSRPPGPSQLKITTRPCGKCGETSITKFMCAGCHFSGWREIGQGPPPAKPDPVDPDTKPRCLACDRRPAVREQLCGYCFLEFEVQA